MLFILQELMFEEGKSYFENSANDIKGYSIFQEFIKHLFYRNLANYDSMVLITAQKGAGKSSAGLMMSKEWCKMIGRPYSPSKYIAYSNAQVLQKIDELEKFSPLLLDESVRFASAADWAKKESKALKKKIAEVRTKHLLFILCFPLKINRLEKNYLESFVNYWIELYDRGKGAVFVKDKNPVADSWRMKDFLKLGSYNEFTPTSKIEQVLRKHANFWSMIKFPKPSEKLYMTYLKTREQNVYDDMDVLASLSKEDVYTALMMLTLRDIMVNDQTLSLNRILLHIKNEYDINLSKNDVQKVIENSRQLVEKIKDKTLDLNEIKEEKELEGSAIIDETSE